MAEILGLGCTHRPLMLRRDEDWTSMMRTALSDPDMPSAYKDPSSWPAELRDELATTGALPRQGVRVRSSGAISRRRARHSTSSSPMS